MSSVSCEQRRGQPMTTLRLTSDEEVLPLLRQRYPPVDDPAARAQIQARFGAGHGQRIPRPSRRRKTVRIVCSLVVAGMVVAVAAPELWDRARTSFRYRHRPKTR